jgi:hypothetical protein
MNDPDIRWQQRFQHYQKALDIADEISDKVIMQPVGLLQACRVRLQDLLDGK